MTYVAMRGNAKKTAPGISARRFSLAALLFLILVAASRSSIKKFHFQNSNEGGRRILLKESSIDDIIKEYPLSMHVTVAKINVSALLSVDGSMRLISFVKFNHKRHLFAQVPSPFLYAYLYEDQDSYQVSDANIRALEPGITALLVEKIATCCGSGGHFIDVGSHFGYYSMLAASLGCSYSAFEPVPAFQKLIKLNQVLNGVQHQGDVYEFAIGDVEAEALIKVPSTGVLGLARIKRYENGTLINPAHRNQTEGEILTVKTRRMNSKKYNIPTTDKRICAMKIDVEGDEPYGKIPLNCYFK